MCMVPANGEFFQFTPISFNQRFFLVSAPALDLFFKVNGIDWMIESFPKDKFDRKSASSITTGVFFVFMLY